MDEFSLALARLGLQAPADEKEVRRAYARELKKIDQDAELSAFQPLRQAYELALKGQGVSVQAPAHSPREMPADEAQETYDWLVAAVQVISEGRRIADESIWVDSLRQQLAERQPEGFDAGRLLEAAIGRLLARGWQPGHEALLIAATEHFGWDAEGRWPNIEVAEAWFERFILHRQRESLRAPLLRVIRDLRQQHDPDLANLRRDHRYFDHLATYYSNLIPLIVDIQTVERWRSLTELFDTPEDVSCVEPRGNLDGCELDEADEKVLALQAAFVIVVLICIYVIGYSDA